MTRCAVAEPVGRASRPTFVSAGTADPPWNLDGGVSRLAGEALR